jgi:hypothetical protein
MPDTQWAERTALARERSALAMVLIAALLLTHAHAALSVASALVVGAAGLSAQSPRGMAGAAVLAAVAAAVIVVV